MRLAPDFPGPPREPEQPESWDDEEAHLLYVAVTRASARLDISACEPALYAWHADEHARPEAFAPGEPSRPGPSEPESNLGADPDAQVLELEPELWARLERCAAAAQMTPLEWLEHITRATLERAEPSCTTAPPGPNAHLGPLFSWGRSS